jgi:hypothetical protein
MECLALSTQCSTELVHVLTKQHRKRVEFVLFPRIHSFDTMYERDYEKQSVPEALNPFRFLRSVCIWEWNSE